MNIFVLIYFKYSICELIVSKEACYENHFDETLYYKWFKNTQRTDVNLFWAILDIWTLAPWNYDTFIDFYNKYSDNPSIVATLMWTYNTIIIFNYIIYKPFFFEIRRRFLINCYVLYLQNKIKSLIHTISNNIILYK